MFINWCKNSKKKILNPRTARPATPSPITVPPENDTFNACGKLVLAACVVRTFDFVAIRIPIFPAKAEKIAPKMKATTIIQCDTPEICETANKATDAITTKMAKIRYSAFKNAIAPS